ncbi:autotransporter family protein [Mesorhizobium xinjiangense]|uniref:autotransporter family protein n=1 Tax=Mesorhizobium xinjiangense TaxID=2678685 RepID=UPI0018DE8551|nr:autotransporter outer membrane beta-barrel domain-containing protein [Mesorhizobium xinjiangense]
MLDGTTVTATGTTNATNVIGGMLIVQPTVNISTVSGHAFLTNGTSARILIDGASVTTSGVGTGLAAIGGTIDVTDVALTATGNNSTGYGAIAQDSGTITLGNGTTITRGTAGRFGNTIGIGASGTDSSVMAGAVVPVTMNGRGAMGLYLHDGGQVSLVRETTIQLNGTTSVGISIDNTEVPSGSLDGLTVNLAGTGTGASSTGLVAMNGGDITISDLTVEGSNAGAGVWAHADSSITLQGNSVIKINATTNPQFFTLNTDYLITANGSIRGIFGATAATPGAGLMARSGSITSIGTSVTVDSSGQFAGAFTNDGAIKMTNNTIVTKGALTHGIFVNTGSVTAHNSSITTQDGPSALRINFGTGLIDMTNTTVEATGPGTLGLITLNGTDSGENTVRLSGGSLTSAQSAAVIARGPLNMTVTDGAVVTGGGGLLLGALDQGSFYPQQTIVNLDASGGSVLTGSAGAEPDSIANISLLSGAQWTGAAFDVTNVDIGGGSLWTVTDSSVVTGKVNNAGTINFTAPADDPAELASYKTLATPDYTGAGGTLGLNTFLADDASPSDRLVIDGGAATGSTGLAITDAGGGGALTSGDGILVVDTVNGGTTDADAFTLAGPVVAGPYEYNLFRGGLDATTPQNWYLRSEEGIVDPCPDPDGDGDGNGGENGGGGNGGNGGDGGNGGGGGGGNGGNGSGGNGGQADPFRPEVALYASNPQLALRYGSTLLDTLHQRRGDDRAAGLGSQAAGSQAWARTVARHGWQSCAANLDKRLDYDLLAFQGGLDLYHSDDADGASDVAGIYGVIGWGWGDSELFDEKVGSNTLDAYTIGGYWTHYGKEGWYLDALVQGTWYDLEADSVRPFSLATDGVGFGASLEAGYPFPLDDGWIIEPQAQLTYQTISIDDASDGTATVSYSDIDSLRGRLGVRLARAWELDPEDPEPRLITAWFRPSLAYQFLEKPVTTFSSAAGPVPFDADFSGASVILNAGFDADIRDNVALYANADYEIAFDQMGESIGAEIGLKIRW